MQHREWCSNDVERVRMFVGVVFMLRIFFRRTKTMHSLRVVYTFYISFMHKLKVQTHYEIRINVLNVFSVRVLCANKSSPNGSQSDGN